MTKKKSEISENVGEELEAAGVPEGEQRVDPAAAPAVEAKYVARVKFRDGETVYMPGDPYPADSPKLDKLLAWDYVAPRRSVVEVTRQGGARVVKRGWDDMEHPTRQERLAAEGLPAEPLTPPFED